MQVQRRITFDLDLGESPLWDDRRSILWFIDITSNNIHALDPHSGNVETHPMPALVASLGLVEDDSLLVALRTGVYFYQPETRNLRFLCHPEPAREATRLNDGKVGPDGCFWVGSMSETKPRAPTGSLYRVSPDGSVETILNDLFVSNGLAWSPLGDTMYHADSRGIGVSAYDFDPAEGRAKNGRVLIRLSEEQGLPDGAAVDIEGNYWSAGITAGCLNCISPKGELLRTIELPVAAPTMPCFGGKSLETMFVTSLTTDRTGQAQKGTLLSLNVGVQGVPIHRFGVGERLMVGQPIAFP